LKACLVWLNTPRPAEQEAREMLMAQARTLNALFAGLIRRATAAQRVEQTEGYMRVALKAQAQCARTVQLLESLAAIHPRPSTGKPGHADASERTIAESPQ